MKLIEIQIQNFRSVEDSHSFRVGELTCLVGKNEAGKTAILQALQSIRPFGKAQTDYDVTLNYPRRFYTRYAERHPTEEARIVHTTWTLSDAARAALAAEFGAESIVGETVEISKLYKTEGTVWRVPIDEQRAIVHLLSNSNLDAVERAPLNAASTGRDLFALLETMGSRTAKQEAVLSTVKRWRDHSPFLHAIDLLDAFVPLFFYASHYDRMSGEVSIDQLNEDASNKVVSAGDQIFLDFLKLAGTSLEELKDAGTFEELSAQVEASSSEITEQIFKYWTQNDALEVRIGFTQAHDDDPPPFNTGTVVRARVHNNLHKASVPFSERSAGFVWFFSFLVQFASMRSEAGNAIILLDEPGLTLHGKAQADLLRYIEEELLPHHQVIFTTHSPFMVPADRFSDVRVVEDVVVRAGGDRPVVHGTQVTEEVLATSRDTLFPLQGALGYDIVQSLFVGKNTLLVEGPSDVLYLQAISSELKRRKRTGLDARWTLCPAGGIDKIRPFAALFGSNNIRVAALTDQSLGDKRRLEDLRRSQLLGLDGIHTFADFLSRAEADVEDLFQPATFVALLNQAYGLGATDKLTVKKLSDALPGSSRLVKQAEAAFRLMPSSVAEFDHFTPASWLIQNPSIIAGDSQVIDQTLDLAERIFGVFNGLLPNQTVS